MMAPTGKRINEGERPLRDSPLQLSFQMSFSFLYVSFPNFQLLFSSCEGYKLANAVEQIKKGLRTAFSSQSQVQVQQHYLQLASPFSSQP